MSEPTIDLAMRAVADHLGVSLRDLMGPSRRAEIVWPRHVAMWVVRETTGASLPRIGRAFGGRDHTTVLYAVRKVEAARRSWRPIRDETDLVREAVEDRLFTPARSAHVLTPPPRPPVAPPDTVLGRLRYVLRGAA